MTCRTGCLRSPTHPPITVLLCACGAVEPQFKGALPQLTVGLARVLSMSQVDQELERAGADALRGNTFSRSPSVMDLFFMSGVRPLLECLLGGPAVPHPAAQLALRFPGDACGGDDFWAHWEGHRKYWHIDGCANDALPGVTDHHGEVHNFDCLVGVLLSDVPDRFSGELACYPGSHEDLAQHFR